MPPLAPASTPASTVSQPITGLPGTQPAGLSQEEAQKRIQETVSRIGRNPIGQEEQDLVYRATFSPEELKQLGLDQPFQQLQGQFGQAQQSLSATPAPTRTGLRVLEEALNAKNTVTNQPLGESELFKQAGLSGYAVLNQSLAQRSNEMATKYDSFKARVSDVSQAMVDTYNLAVDRYNLLKGEMDEEDLKYQNFIDEANQYERALNLIQDQAKIDKEFFKYKFDLEQAAAEKAAQAKEKAGVFSYEAPITTGGKFTNRVTGSGTITSDMQTDIGSSAWKWGLDVAASKGSAILSPGNGEIIKIEGGYVSVGVNNKAGLNQNSGFGNQVKIRLEDGREIWVSHLDAVNPDLFVGQQVTSSQKLGTMGNTGYTIGNTGVHTDITMKDEDGNYMRPSQVAQYIRGDVGEIALGVSEALEQSTLPDFMKNILGKSLPPDLQDKFISVKPPPTPEQEAEIQTISPLFDLQFEDNETFITDMREATEGMSKAKAKVRIQQGIKKYLASEELDIETETAIKDILAPYKSELQELTDYQLEFLYNLTQQGMENLRQTESEVKIMLKEALSTTVNAAGNVIGL